MIIAALVLGMYDVRGDIGARIEVPLNPEHGIAVGRNGRFYLNDDGYVTTYELRNSKLERTSQIGRKYGKDLEFLPHGQNVTIVDYDNDKAFDLNFVWREQWSAEVRSPNGAKLDPKGKLWVFALQGSVLRKTPDSSAIEPVLNKYGEELFHPGLYDLEPISDEDYYLLRENGELWLTGKTRIPKKLATMPKAEKLVASRLGGVLVYDASGTGSIVRVTTDGKSTTLWTAPANFGAVKHMSRTGDGKILLAGPSTMDTGFAYIIDPEAGAK